MQCARYWLLVACLALNLSASVVAADPPPPEKFTPKLRITFSSYRRTERQPKLYFYEHDGVSRGKITGTIETGNKESDSHSSVAAEGRLIAFAHELENKVSQIVLWDVDAKAYVELPDINKTTNAQLCPSITADGKRIAFAAWSRPGSNQRWDLLLYDLASKQTVPLPGLNSQFFDERMPAFSRNGKWLAYTSNDRTGVGQVDVLLYDMSTRQVVTIPKLNSPAREVDPRLNADGQLVVFSSNRLGGKGGRDIYLFDRKAEKFLPLPGLNSVAHEQSPSLSANGRFIAFVSERITGAGNRDVYLYDRQAGKLLPTPDLNAAVEDFDPCVILLEPKQ